MEYVGTNGSLLFFSDSKNGVVIDPDLNMVVRSGRADVLSLEESWSTSEFDIDISDSVVELAEASLSTLDIGIVASSGRKYTIPAGVQSEAKKALNWRKENGRGGTPVGLNTAHTLAEGGQIGIEKVRHIAKYFPRHEVDKKGKGWSPKEDGFPSNGRIAWALWGGDAGQRWASAIVEAENKKAMTADGYALPSYESIPDAQAYDDMYTGDINDFSRDDVYAPDFIARVRMDGSGIDRLYKIDDDGNVYVWDNGAWDDLGNMHSNIWERDLELDGEDDTVEKTHVTIDPQSAITIAALLQEDPFRTVSIEDIDDGEEESRMAMDALPEIDWNIVELAMTAAGDTTKANAEYTPEERSKAASSQVRDATGKFATAGSRVVVDKDPSKQGSITRVDKASGTVSVKLDSGQTVQVAGTQTTKASNYVYPPAVPSTPDTFMPLDLSGMLGEPRTPIDRPMAQLPGTLPALTAKDLHDLLADWPSWVSGQRAQYNALPATEKVAVQERGSTNVGEAGKALEKLAGEKLSLNAYKHPLLKKWLKQKTNGVSNSLWYQPITSAGDQAVEITPETTDVQPIYMAIVSPDDPRAVMQLSVLVPENTKSNNPMVWTRQQGTWVKDAQTLADLNSATPPPVVPLDDKVLNDVLKQVDQSQETRESAPQDERTVTASATLSPDLVFAVLVGEKYNLQAIIAAGGFDRNRGNAEELRRYWTKGKGALKIRWGTPGDWKRCVRHLSKYMGVRAKGYCQLRHKEALGIYTATHAKRDRNASMEEVIYDVYPTEVTKEDLDTPIDQIIAEEDMAYDDTWEPEPHLIGYMEELAKCKDSEFEALTAAGGIDRNRGNAEELRRYWTVGKGGLKIRWNTPGDWTRCVRNLRKYLGARAKGYCALRHKEMDGYWPGDKRNRELSYQDVDGRVYSADVLRDSEEINTLTVLNARRQEVIDKVNLIAGKTSIVAGAESAEGARFYIPLVIPEEMESGDGRIFKKGAIEIRDLPLPLLWQYKTGDGHDGSVVVGRIDHMERVDGGIGNAFGVFDTGAYGKEAERLVRNGFIRGVSADMDRFDAQEEEDKEATTKDDGKRRIKKSRININNARVMAVTIVPKPAFQECRIYLPEDGEYTPQEEPTMQDGIYTDEVDPSDAEAIMACGLVASAIPVAPPKDWFTDPKLGKATPLTVDDEGRVFGHIASWSTNHIGLSNGVKPPRSKSKYGYFHTGVCRTAEGADIPVGQLTLAGGHAPLYASASDAVKHYDDTASAVADVHAGEDRFGIWVAGALRPGVQPEQIRTLRASAPSGDWRPIGGSLELVAVCQVNVPGFPIARAMVASGQVTALVAAGAATLARMKADPMAELQGRIAKLEKLTLSDKKSELSARVKGAEFNYDGQVEIVNPAVEDLARILDGLLADVVNLKFRAHGYHWNVEGKHFPQYHELFGEIYTDIDGSIDPLAENVRKLGFPVTFDISAYASETNIPEPRLKDSKCQAMAYDLYCANSVLLGELKHAFDVANMANEQGVANFLAERIDAHQKWAWQLRVSSTDGAHEYTESEQDEYIEHNPQQVYEVVFSDLSKNGVLEAVVASAESNDELVDSFAAVMEFADFSPLQRKNLAQKGEALPDGSYPIRNEGDLKNAIKAFGRAKESERGDVKKHIIKRARALKKSDLIPENWTKKSMTASAHLDRMRDKLATFENLGAVSEDDPKKAFSGIATSQLPLELSNEEFEVFASAIDAELKKMVKKTVADAPVTEGDIVKAIDATNPTAVPQQPVPTAQPSTTQPTAGQPQAKEVVSETGKTTVQPDTEVVQPTGETPFGKYVPGKTQPRDVQGRFRLVLARLKQDLGTSGNQDVIAKIAETENLIGNVGNYAGAVKSASDLINTIDRLDSGALNAKSVENVRATTTELGKTIANLPLPFENQATKVRFSDLPATLKSLAKDLITRVEEKIGKEEADVATKELRGFMSGSDVYNQGEVSSQFNRLLRLLT